MVIQGFIRQSGSRALKQGETEMTQYLMAEELDLDTYYLYHAARAELPGN